MSGDVWACAQRVVLAVEQVLKPNYATSQSSHDADLDLTDHNGVSYVYHCRCAMAAILASQKMNRAVIKERRSMLQGTE